MLRHYFLYNINNLLVSHAGNVDMLKSRLDAAYAKENDDNTSKKKKRKLNTEQLSANNIKSNVQENILSFLQSVTMIGNLGILDVIHKTILHIGAFDIVLPSSNSVADNRNIIQNRNSTRDPSLSECMIKCIDVLSDCGMKSDLLYLIHCELLLDAAYYLDETSHDNPSITSLLLQTGE